MRRQQHLVLLSLSSVTASKCHQCVSLACHCCTEMLFNKQHCSPALVAAAVPCRWHCSRQQLQQQLLHHCSTTHSTSHDPQQPRAEGQLSPTAQAVLCPFASCCLMMCMASSSNRRARLFLPSFVRMPTSFSSASLSAAVRCCCCCCCSAAAAVGEKSLTRDLNEHGTAQRHHWCPVVGHV